MLDIFVNFIKQEKKVKAKKNRIVQRSGKNNLQVYYIDSADNIVQRLNFVIDFLKINFFLFLLLFLLLEK